jgi:hypothetical protein
MPRRGDQPREPRPGVYGPWRRPEIPGGYLRARSTATKPASLLRVSLWNCVSMPYRPVVSCWAGLVDEPAGVEARAATATNDYRQSCKNPDEFELSSATRTPPPGPMARGCRRGGRAWSSGNRASGRNLPPGKAAGHSMQSPTSSWRNRCSPLHWSSSPDRTGIPLSRGNGPHLLYSDAWIFPVPCTDTGRPIPGHSGLPAEP